MSVLAVAAGGALGALVRYWLERYAVHRVGERVPYGTLAANLIGAALLGAVFGLHERETLSDTWLLFLGTGFCGALTTFSGLMGQVWSRARHVRTRALAVAYLGGTFAAGYALVLVTA